MMFLFVVFLLKFQDDLIWEYHKILGWISIIGYLIFSEIPSYQTLLGALIIILSLIGLLIWEKNR